MGNTIVLDCEADGFIFESTQVWTVCGYNVDTGEKIKVNPFKDSNAKQKLLDFIFTSDTPYIAGHFWLGYDAFVLQNLIGLEFTVGKDTICGKPVQFIDTFYLSMFLNPDRQAHSIDYFGGILGLPKIDWRGEAIELGLIEKNSPKGSEFMQWNEQMDVYCERDVAVNTKVLKYLKDEWKEVYQKDFEITDAFKCGQKAFYLMSCQELTGWKFDINLAHKLKAQIEQMMEDIRAEVEPKLPPRPLKKSEEKEYTMPAKPFKQNGELSAAMLKWIDKHNGIEKGNGVWEFYGKEYKIVAGQMLDVQMPMEMANQDQMKDWFISQGWESTLWNYQRGPDGKPMRDPKTRQLIPTSPKIQEAGKICPNLMKMEGDIVKQVVRWLSLRNRLSVLQGWLENPRLQMDGRIGAGRTGIAATHRQKHKTVVNVPKASEKVLLGKEFRSLWTSEDGFLIAAGDAAALEGRVQGHYCVPMDTQALTKHGWKNFDELVDGEDILAYNPETGMKEWTTLLEKCVFEDAEVFAIENNNFKVRATANHRWFVEYRNTTTGKFYQKVVETKDLNTCCNIITNAPMRDYSGTVSGILDGKYGQNRTGRVVSRGLNGVESFIEGFLVADGHYSNQNAEKGADTQEKGKGRWRFGQNLGEHFDAALTAAYIAHNGYLNVSYRDTPTNRMGIVTLNKKSTITMQRMTIKSTGSERVWCPRTKFGSWVMRQGDVITITGNTYRYDNGATAEELLKGDVHCFAEDTEILTPYGWKRFNDLDGALVAQYRGGVIEFVKPSEVIWKKYAGTMIHFESASLDKLVTPNHRVLLQSHKTGKEVVKFAKDVSNTNADLRIKVAGESEGVQLSSAEITLISAIQSDAYDSGCAYRFEFKKTRKTERLIGALTAMNADYTYTEGETSRIYVPKKGLGLIQPYVTEKRELSYELLKVSGDTGKELLKEYGYWDGTVKENGDIVLDTTSRQTVEVLQALACKSGMKTSLTVGIKKVTTFGECFVDRLYISVTSKPVVRVYGTQKEVEYSGMIGCVTVPSGFIVVRRNGKVCVSGNSKNAIAFYGHLPELKGFDPSSPDFNKEDPVFKPFRDRSKNGYYCIMYGGGAPKVASTLGLPERMGKEKLDLFWEVNPATKSLKENLEKYWETRGRSLYLPAIDGRILRTRKKSALLNTIFQSCGGITMDYACCFLDSWLGGIKWKERKPYYLYKGYVVRRIGYMHDEVEFECEEPIADEVARMIEKAIEKAGQYLKLSVPLAGEGKVGKDWRSVH